MWPAITKEYIPVGCPSSSKISSPSLNAASWAVDLLTMKVNNFFCRASSKENRIQIKELILPRCNCSSRYTVREKRRLNDNYYCEMISMAITKIIIARCLFRFSSSVIFSNHFLQTGRMLPRKNFFAFIAFKCPNEARPCISLCAICFGSYLDLS